MTPAIFLDKDGTLVRDVPYNRDPAAHEWMPGVAEGLPKLSLRGYKLIVVTNQGGIARGMISVEDIERISARLRSSAEALGAEIADVYYCPHDTAGTVPDFAIECDCRKPRPGLLLRAAQEHNIDLSRSWMIGDILNDVQAGHEAGVQTILVDVGNETLWQRGPLRTPHHHVTHFADAVRIILESTHEA